MFFVGLFPHSESLVVKRLTGFKNRIKRLTLFGSRIDTVLVCFNHCDSTFWFRKFRFHRNARNGTGFHIRG